ncbi:YbjQ family protein [Singulisphaera acidiphila]|uniref:Uncharacterized protein n=1 Tax=Singulisphaera acidiphila (strain ATCC BAA-1392 / DSM 18658 / VKM B-2454 / MOB10) TaxID=886293 RepID=L0DM94_SINAD|nr:heavy metal-binding domain-containing protein [Singulisphaera acidiphila]AGA29963.1 hypothetical protein Sinac_5842 [Singulisphaera acidiphila DSM 18658]
MTCSKCGKRQGVLSLLSADLGGAPYICPDCEAVKRAEVERQRVDEAKEEERIKVLARQVIITTTHSVDGYYVKRYIGLESVEYVIGTGIFSELSTGLADIFGKRSTAFEEKLQTAKKIATSTLKVRAAKQGANAVVGIDMDYAEFDGNRVALILNGTLVEIERRPARGS